MLELYNAPESTCSQRVRMALAEKNLAWVDRKLSLQNQEHLSADYLALNPDGLVPTLVHDGRVIADSSVIMEYLEDIHPHPALRPDCAWARAQMRKWTHYIDEVPTPATRIPSFHHVFGRALRALPPAALGAVAAARPLRKHMYLRIGPNGFPDQDLSQAMEQIGQAYDRVELALAQGPWINGALLSLADISLLPIVVRMQDLGMTGLLAGHPRVNDWYERLQRRASFAAAYGPGTRIGIPASA